jgi:hypothetical protein
VTVVAMPPPDPGGRVRSGHGAMVTLTGVRGRMIEPERRGRDVLQFPVGEPEGNRPVGGFAISRPAFRGASRTESGWLAIEVDGLHVTVRPVQEAGDAAGAQPLTALVGAGMPVSTRCVMRMWLPLSSRNAASIP